MNSGSRIALGISIALGAVTAGAIPAGAQAPAPVRTFTMTKQERAAIFPLQSAILAGDFAAAAAALPAAEASAGSPDARYFVGQYKLRLGIATGNTQIQNQGMELILASGVAPSGDLSEMYSNQAALAAGKGDLKKADAAYSRLVELNPNDSASLAMLAEVKNDMGKIPESVALMDRAIAARQASGQTVPEGWYKRALKTALDAKMAPQTMKFSRQLVAAYPDTENWRDAGLAYRDVGGFDPDGRLDLYRLMRAAKALHGERDYQEYANAFNTASLAGEAKSVLDEGVSRKMVDPAKPAFKTLIAQTAARAATGKAGLSGLAAKAMAAATGTAALGAGDAYFGQGDYTKAAELYTAAAQKGSIDANLANLRLGEALALGGRRAEAETALRAVTGPRAELAGLWLAWLARRA